MDTMYFAKDMNSFVGQIYGWLKEDGVFFVSYQEGDIMPKTKDNKSTVLANALRQNAFKYECLDFTKQTYEMLKQKTKSIIKFKESFEKENIKDWFSVILAQIKDVDFPFDEYKKNNARYLYIAKK